MPPRLNQSNPRTADSRGELKENLSRSGMFLGKRESPPNSELDSIRTKKLKTNSFSQQFRKLRDMENRHKLKKVLSFLGNQGMVYKELETSDEFTMIVCFRMPSEPSKGEIRLKIFIEDSVCSVGFDQSKSHKKMIKKAAENIDKDFDDSIREILLYWKKEVK